VLVKVSELEEILEKIKTPHNMR